MELVWAESGWRVSYSLLKIEVFQRSEPVLVQAVTRGASRGSPSRHSVARLLSSRRELALCRVLLCALHTLGDIALAVWPGSWGRAWSRQVPWNRRALGGRLLKRKGRGLGGWRGLGWGSPACGDLCCWRAALLSAFPPYPQHPAPTDGLRPARQIRTTQFGNFIYMKGTKMGTVGGKFLCKRQPLLRLLGAALPVSEAPACLLNLQTA